jgi:transcriptional regulator with XRE-family HTH domain
MERARVVGRELGLLRRARGWSIEEVAARLDVPARQLRQIEHGRRPIPIDVLLKLARAFGKSLHQFFGGELNGGPVYRVRRSSDIRSTSPHIRRWSNEESASMSTRLTYYPLVSHFPSRHMFPYLIDVPNTGDRAARARGHHGEEFIYVLEGQLELTTLAEEQEVKEILRPGDSCFLDSSVPHTLRAETKNPLSTTSAQVLDVFWCPLGEIYLFADE